MRKAVWFNKKHYDEYLRSGSLETFSEFVKSAFYDKIKEVKQ